MKFWETDGLNQEFIYLAEGEEETATTESTQASSENAEESDNPFAGNSFGLFLYGALFLFMLYNFIKGHRAKKHIKGERYEYDLQSRKSVLVLVVLVAVLGGVNIYTGNLLVGALMIGIAILFFLQTREKAVVSESGIYADGQYYSWDDVKRWGWDKQRGDLVVQTKEFGKQAENHYMRIGIDHMVDINNRIRQFKLGKPSPEEVAQEIEDEEVTKEESNEEEKE